MKRVSLAFAAMVALMFSAFVVSEEPAASQTPDKRPNIVFINLDDSSTNLLFQMPTIQNRMWKLGTRLPNSFYSMAWCGPSRASMLTGKYPHNHRVGKCNKGAWDIFKMSENSTYATWLQDSGYRTGYIGKYMNGYNNTNEVPPGWDYWNGWLGEYGIGTIYRINENGVVRAYSRSWADRNTLHDTDYMSWRAAGFIRNNARSGKPWMLTVAPNAPHVPGWTPKRHKDAFENAILPKPPSFNEADMSDKGSFMRSRPSLTQQDVVSLQNRHRARLRAMLSVDQLVANVLNSLRDTGQMSNTYIVLWNDNGYHLGTHRLLEGKLFPYEEDVRYPMLVRGPGVPVNRAMPQMALNADIAPTFADIAGTDAPDVDGRSLLPVFKGRTPEQWRSAVFMEFPGAAHPLAPPPYRVVRTDTEKYIEWEGEDREFYDLRKDPFELNGNPDAVDPARVAELERRLRELENCAGASCRAAEDG